MLHVVLGLPAHLLGDIQTTSMSNHANRLSETQAHYNSSVRADFKRRDSSPTRSRASLYSMALGAQSSQDFLRAGTSTKSMRLMNTFLDVLRVFTQHKFICFCLDDLQFADDESLDLITSIVSSRMKIILIVTYRPDEVLPERIRGIIEPPNAEGIRLSSLPLMNSYSWPWNRIRKGRRRWNNENNPQTLDGRGHSQVCCDNS